MRIFTELLFQHGHIADVALAKQPGGTGHRAVEAMQRTDLNRTAGSSPRSHAQAGQTMTEPPALRRHAEKRMARRARRAPGCVAMTALSPFR
ncbi:hypothetical protein [Xanthomonas axonopodis]